MSREIDILNKISVGRRYEGTPHSRSERILKAIANSEEYADEAVGRYETLLLCLLNGTTTTFTPQSRIEKILISLINNEEPPSVFESELERAFVDAFIDVKDAYVDGNILYLVNVPANQNEETLNVVWVKILKLEIRYLPMSNT